MRSSLHLSRALTLFTFLALTSGCSDDNPSLVVEVVSGIVPVAQFATAEASILVPNGASGTEAIDSHEVIARIDQDFAHGFRIAEFGSVTPGEHTINVVLRKADGRLLIQRRTRVNIVGNYVLRVHVTPNCIGVVCPSPSGNAGFSECLDGHCVDPRCNPPSHEFCDEVTFCGTPSDCRETSSCATATCIDSICDAASIPGACPETEWCDPLAGAGCEPFFSLDGGVDPDASTDGGVANDASVDGGPLCGSTCVDPANMCLFGVIDCSGELPVCNASLVRTGTVCGDGLVCDVTGACAPCAEGGECQVGCATGHLSCATGTPACFVESTSPRLPTGNMCETSCGTAGTCPTPHVCSPAGECITCIDDAPCTSGCEMGRISCADGGVCVLDNTHVAPFTPCGAAHICDGRGECVTCLDGAAYEDGCYGGTITACGTAAPTAASRSLLAATSSCGETEVCSGDGYGCYEPYRALNVVPMAGYPEDYAHVRATCALLLDHTVQCWGSNRSGALGWGRVETPALHTKVSVVGLTNVVELAGGGGFFCARTDAGEVWCWGRNASGELGNGTQERAISPVQAMLPAAAVQVVAGARQACAIVEGGDVYCWGELPRDPPVYIEQTSIPQLVPTLHGVRKLVAFPYFSGGGCALLDTGHIRCWGEALGGAFGDGVMRDGFSGGFLGTPVEVAIIDDAIDFDHNGLFGCAVRANHETWCWGGHEYITGAAGFLGDMAGTHVAFAPIHADAMPESPADAVSVIVADHPYVRRASGEWWGFTSGQPPALAAPPLDHAQRIENGTHYCAVTSDGEAVCWGTNTEGCAELGSGHGVPSVAMTPVAVIGETP